ncbi:unnamed protein product [Didymodactylos carnosus]|uniref:Uncharacterized protein n=1 Tax=Didymodactylos carnosus TaxID=1234261 RepID=A0A8S2VK49_9BILA|nr:unnamed protein product [Didymodactylos carnosus]
MEETNIVELGKTILIAKKWDKLLQSINQCQLRYNLIQNLLKEIKSVVPFIEMISELEKLVNELKTQLNVELISGKTTKFEVKREEVFINLMKTLDRLRMINLKLKDVLSELLDVDKVEGDLKKKVERISSQLIAKASKELSSRDADDFRMYYNHLLSFEKHVRIPEVNIRLVLEQSEEKFFEKLTFLRREIINSSSDTTNICEMLNKMKFLAENLSMFDTSINKEIDETLKNYKGKYGNVGIIRVTVELKKTDMGGRLISKHSCLSGEDRRKRREKMQKQDDLEYALKELIGDEHSTDVLRSRYAIFRQKYDELVSIITIFRLRGIGYDNHKKFKGHKIFLTGKISNDLINNLAEIDTGKVFRALGIEDRIEYGTFNKLCELLLNKQCNVRERVRDVIVNNQSTLAVFDTSVRIRLKVLLIDEVDVFLSEKFCGGTYTPSVYLKDLSIKALLDSIREDETLKTLNKVKTLSAYKNCATKYSN